MLNTYTHCYYSLTSRSCVDSNGNKIAPTRRYHGAFSVTTFDNVGEYFTSTARRGRRFVTLTEDEYITVCIDAIDWPLWIF